MGVFFVLVVLFGGRGWSEREREGDGGVGGVVGGGLNCWMFARLLQLKHPLGQ